MTVVSLDWTTDDYALLGESPDGDPALRYEGPSSLAEIVVRPPWMRDGLCREFPEVEFFPERGQSAEPAKAICGRCAVRSECLSFALAGGEVHGIYGGLSGRQRRALRREQATAA